MAIMSRRKKANARLWDSVKKSREDKDKPTIEKKEEINEEEHKKRIEKLKELGLIKD